jgi:hypothetical protein
MNRGRGAHLSAAGPRETPPKGVAAADPEDNEFCVLPEIGLKGDG